MKKSDRPLIRWTETAKTDLGDIGEYIAADNPQAAARWIETLLQTVERAATTPLVGRRVPELQHPDIREMIKGNYRVVYRVAERGIDVLTIFEGHRQLPGLSGIEVK